VIIILYCDKKLSNKRNYIAEDILRVLLYVLPNRSLIYLFGEF
jgi:hypothetical protein